MWPFSRVPRTAYPVPRTAYRFKNTRIFIVKQYLSYCFTTNILPKTIWILVNTEGRRRGEGKSHLRQGYGGQRKGRRGVFASRHYAFTPLRHCAITPLRLYAFTPFLSQPHLLYRLPYHPGRMFQLFKLFLRQMSRDYPFDSPA